MTKSTSEAIDAVVIGAGHAGLAVSYYLASNNISHVVFERSRIGESWRSQRWDSFALNTPNWMNVLPGDPYAGDNREGFCSKDEFVCSLNSYATKFHLPVKEQTAVQNIGRTDDVKYFTLNAISNDNPLKLKARQVVIASGILNAPRIPSFQESISKKIYQIHTSQYRNPSLLPPGNVLVVGSGQSGCQIAEDLLLSGRKIFFSTSRVGRVPRRYRGRDILDWLNELKYYDTAPEDIDDIKLIRAAQPQVSGVGKLGHSVSLQYLHSLGATILGKIEGAEGNNIFLASNAAENVRYADAFSSDTKKSIDRYISSNKISAPAPEKDKGDLPDPEAKCAEDIPVLNLNDCNISSVIWNTGFGSDFSWIKLPVIDNAGKPVHSNGLSHVKGLSFIGFPWLRRRKSGIVFGANEDAKYLAENIIHNLSV